MKKIIAKILVISIVLSFFTGCKKIENKETEEKEEIKIEEQEKRVSFFGVGDNLIHNCIYWQAEKNAKGNGYDFKPMYEDVKEYIEKADISYINQETILGGTELKLSSYPMFNSPKELGRDMMDLGFDLFSHATNHVFDKGEQGIKNTYEFYENNPKATMIGIYKKGEENIKIIDKNGIKIAFMNYTYPTNGLSLRKDSEFYVPLVDYDNKCINIVENIKKAKEKADFTVCMIHWGDENHTKPNEMQKETAKIMADAGCDVIVGSHPHSIQPVEFYNDTLIIYSLGNFISAQKQPLNMLGGTISFDFVLKGEEKKIENVSFMPVITQYEGTFKNIRIIPFPKYTKELAESHGVNLTYDYFLNVINNTIDGKYLQNLLKKE